MAKRKNDIISVLDDTVARAIEIVKGALNEEVATIIEFTEKIEKAIKTIEKNSRSKHTSAIWEYMTHFEL